MSRKTRIVILGGGFGGVYTAIGLEKRLGRDPDVEIALVSRENYFVFQPMLPEVISGSIGIVDTITPIRRLAPRAVLYTRTIDSIDLSRRRVTTDAGVGTRHCVLDYDHLVIALGNVQSFMGVPGLAEHALPFKYLGDALALRNRIILALEEADIETDPEVRRAMLTFVVAGGGFSGVEVVAELNDFVRRVAKSFPRIRTEELRVILLHAGDVILPELPRDLGEFAQRLLVRRGVELRLKTRLQGATAETATLSGGERVRTRTVVSTVPSSPNPLVAALPVAKEKGRLVVNPLLEIPGHPGVWAVGDCAHVVDPDTGQPCPPTAQHAVRQARCIADNIASTVAGRPRRAFRFHGLGKMGSLGHRSAVAEVFGVKLSGFLAWWLWRTVYLMKLPGLDRKVRVAADWTLDLVLPPDIVQLRTDRSVSVRREHFEPGEIVFREGDRGDRLYVIVNGEVEAVRRLPDGGQATLRRLGPGECFGEIALVSETLRTATIRTLTGADVLAVDRDAFHALFGHFPPLRGFVEKLIADRMHGGTPPDEPAPKPPGDGGGAPAGAVGVPKRSESWQDPHGAPGAPRRSGPT